MEQPSYPDLFGLSCLEFEGHCEGMVDFRGWAEAPPNGLLPVWESCVRAPYINKNERVYGVLHHPYKDLVQLPLVETVHIQGGVTEPGRVS